MFSSTGKWLWAHVSSNVILDLFHRVKLPADVERSMLHSRGPLLWMLVPCQYRSLNLYHAKNQRVVSVVAAIQVSLPPTPVMKDRGPRLLLSPTILELGRQSSDDGCLIRARLCKSKLHPR